MASATEETVLPPRDLDALVAVEELLESARGPLRIGTESGDVVVALPDELRSVLATVVASMRRGQAVTLAPLALRLTTQQAADLLGVSRPTVIKLLEAGTIPYERPSRHRRIRLADLLTYQATRRAERRRALGELSREARDMELYDTPGEDYEAALSEARRKLA